MMPPVVVCYAAAPDTPGQAASPWQAEYAALRAQSVPLALLTKELNFSDKASVPSGAEILWRGEKLSATAYAKLEGALAAQRHRLRTTAQDYSRARQIPGWLATLPDHTAQTRVVPKSHFSRLPAVAEKLGWWPLRVRGYTGRLAGESSLAANPEELCALIASCGEFEGGIALRKAENYLPGSRQRFFIWHQNVWPHPVASAEASELARLAARHFWHPFYSLDVAQRDDGRWRVLSIDDGQVSALKEWSAELFARCLRPSLQPHLA